MDVSQGKATGEDFEIWQTALQHLTSPTLTLYRSVGRYIHEPHNKTGWYLSNTRAHLYKLSDNGTFQTYRPSPASRSTRRLEYIRCSNSFCPPLDLETAKYAYVKLKSNRASVVSYTDVVCPSIPIRRPIPDILWS